MTLTARSVTTEYGTVGPKRWLIEGASGGAKIVRSAREVRDLLDQGRVGLDARVYEITSEPRTLRDVAELADVLGPEAMSEPPVRGPERSAEHESLSEELAILDRPLDEEVEYFDPPRSRWTTVGPILLVLAIALGAAGVGAFAARANVPPVRVSASASGPAPPAPPAQAAPEPVPMLPAQSGRVEPDQHRRHHRVHAGSPSKNAHARP